MFYYGISDGSLHCLYDIQKYQDCCVWGFYVVVILLLFFFLKTKTKKQNINKNLDWKNMEEKFNVSKWYLRSEGESSTVFYITVWKQNARENIYKLGAVPQLLAVKVLFPLQVT